MRDLNRDVTINNGANTKRSKLEISLAPHRIRDKPLADSFSVYPEDVRLVEILLHYTFHSLAWSQTNHRNNAYIINNNK